MTLRDDRLLRCSVGLPHSQEKQQDLQWTVRYARRPNIRFVAGERVKPYVDVSWMPWRLEMVPETIMWAYTNDLESTPETFQRNDKLK